MEAMVNVKGTVKHGCIINNVVYLEGDLLNITVTKERLQQIRKDFLEGVIDGLQITGEKQRPETPTSEEPKGTEEIEEVNEKPQPKAPAKTANKKK